MKWKHASSLFCCFSMPIGRVVNFIRIHKKSDCFDSFEDSVLIVKGTRALAARFHPDLSKLKEWSDEREKAKSRPSWIYSFLIAFLIPTRQQREAVSFRLRHFVGSVDPHFYLYYAAAEWWIPKRKLGKVYSRSQKELCKNVGCWHSRQLSIIRRRELCYGEISEAIPLS